MCPCADGVACPQFAGMKDARIRNGAGISIAVKKKG